MFRLYADKNKLTLLEREAVTSGSVNVCEVRFDFSADWDGLVKTAVFQAGEVSGAVLLPADGVCGIPWEVLAAPGVALKAGVFGTRDGSVVLPTVWAGLGVILRGANSKETARPPSPGVYEQLLDALERKADGLEYDGAFLSLLSGKNILDTVAVAGGGGEGGISDHRLLSHREDAEQHPIEAISGLEEITNLELLKIWNGG